MLDHDTNSERCWRCGKASPSNGETVCQQCHAQHGAIRQQPQPDAPYAQRCWQCNRLLMFLDIQRGRLSIACSRCKAEHIFYGSQLDIVRSKLATRAKRGAQKLGQKAERSHKRLDVIRVTSSDRPREFSTRFLSDEPAREMEAQPAPLPVVLSIELLDQMEQRWRAAATRRAQERAYMAVGLRFDVFCRDGFRCRYCGTSVDDGAVLHADHVVPQSKGGPTTLDNLVTACIDCNLGKAAKQLPE